MPKNSLVILITNIQLTHYTGTEVFVLEFAKGLKQLNYFPMIYTHAQGIIGDQLKQYDIPVVDDLSLLPKIPDIIHGHHHIPTLQALLYFPNTPAIFVCHDNISWFDIPPLFNRILNYVAIDFIRYNRLVKNYSIPKNKVHILTNFVNIDRFIAKNSLSPIPKRALVFSSYFKNKLQLEAIEKACYQENIALEMVGFGMNQGVAAPEEILSQYDIVFAVGKCALEAISCGRAVIVLSHKGLGEMVTMKNIIELRQSNFIKYISDYHLCELLVRQEIRKYNPEDAFEVSQFIRKEANLQVSIERYLTLYKNTIEEWEQTFSLCANTDSLYSYLQKQLIKMNDHERQLYSSSYMNPLSIEESNKISLLLEDIPLAVDEEEIFSTIVMVVNNTHLKLGSHTPAPLHLSYHWTHINNNKTLIYEGLRTDLIPDLPAGSQGKFEMNIQAPKNAGQYRLILTLVQEGVRWFDSLDQPIGLLNVVTVKPKGLSSNSTKMIHQNSSLHL